jgi:hypothetical protein
MGMSGSTGTYSADSTYFEYYFKENELRLQTEGTWYVKNDTLVQQQNLPEKRESRFYIKMTGDQAELKTKLDWDHDGEKDDFFDARIKKAKETLKKMGSH